MIDIIIAQMEMLQQQHQHHHQHQQQPHESEQEQQQPMPIPIPLPLPLPSIGVDQFSTLKYFWFRIEHLLQWSVFISTDLFVHLSELFIQNIRLNGTYVAYAIARAAMAATPTTQPIKPNDDAHAHANAVESTSFRSQSELFIKNDADNDNLSDIIDAEMNLDHILFCRTAANQQTIIQNKQTDQL